MSTLSHRRAATGPPNSSPAPPPYLADTPADQANGPALQDILRRRGFAVPLPGQRGDGMIDLPEPANGLPAGRTHVDDLDAANPPTGT